MKGLRISPNRQFYDFHYRFSDLVEPISIGKHGRFRGIGRISLMESLKVNDCMYDIYSWVEGPVINQFDLNYKIAFGDILCLCFKDGKPVNININEFLRAFESINLEEPMSTDEEMDEYDFTDGFLVLDEDYGKGDDDYLP